MLPQQALAAAPVRVAPFLAAGTQRRKAGRSAALQVQGFMVRHEPAALQATVGKYVAAVNSQDVEGLCSLLSDQVVWSDRVWSSSNLVGPKKQVCAVYRELFTCYPDYTMQAEDVLAGGEAHTVALHFTCTGTNFGGWRDFPASGRRTTFSGVSLFVFDGKQDGSIRQVITYRQPNAEEYAYYLGHEDM